jgi:hypothetical protein
MTNPSELTLTASLSVMILYSSPLDTLLPACRVTLCSLVRFPKPQVVVYTVLMTPVLYGAAKYMSSPFATSTDWSAGLATIVLVPLPPLAFWAYVLLSWHRAVRRAASGNVQRSRSNLMRTYGSGTVDSHHAQRAAVTLALLGDVTDNPTLIIRDKQPGEEVFEEQVHHSDSSEDGSLDYQSTRAASRPWKARGRTTGVWGRLFSPGAELVRLTDKWLKPCGAGASAKRPDAVYYDADEQNGRWGAVLLAVPAYAQVCATS